MRKAGALKFQMGGPVAMRQQLQAALNSDEVPAILQAGERVLSRGQVAQLGGQGGVDQLLNQGGGGGATQTSVTIQGGKTIQPLLNALIQAVTVEVRAPGSALNAAVAGAAGGVVGSQSVRGRR